MMNSEASPISQDTQLVMEHLKILIVDDQENMCKSIKAMLRILNIGKKYAFAYNGQQALKLLKSNDFDFIILDWGMPVMSGVELLNRIRDDHELRDMPVIMVTAEANKEIVAEVAESDVDAYLLKPLTVKILGNKISKVIEKVNNPPPLMVHLKKARALEEFGKIEDAIKELRTAMAADHESSRPVRELGLLYFRHNQLKEAEICLVNAARMNQMDVFAFHYLGEIHLLRDDIQNAAKFFEKALNISPRHVARAVYFGKILVQNDMGKKARKLFDKAISLSNDAYRLREELADFATANNMHDYAARCYDAIVRQFPDRMDVHYKLGLAYQKTAEYTRSLNHLIKVEKKDPENVAIKVVIARNHLRLNKPMRAEQVLQAALKLDPENEEVRRLLRKTA